MYMLTSVLVAGRGHDTLPGGEIALGESTIARVNTAVDFFHGNKGDFTDALKNGMGGVLVMSGGYATMATGNRIAPPAREQREGFLMAHRAMQQGVPSEHVGTITSPTTTLEVVARPVEAGYFTAISRSHPLGIVTQESQWPRLLWLTERVLAVDRNSVVLIPAPGEEDPSILRDEAMLTLMTRVLYGPARTLNGLRRAEKIAQHISVLLTRIGIVQPPATRYLHLDS